MRKSSPEPKCITMCLKKLSGHIRQGFSFSRQHVSLERLHNMNTLGLAWWLIRFQIPPYLKLHPRGGVGGWECLILWMTQGSLDICIYRWNLLTISHTSSGSWFGSIWTNSCHLMFLGLRPCLSSCKVSSWRYQ